MTVSYDKPTQAQRTVIPREYWIWLVGVSLSLLGSQIMALAMIWTAAGWGGFFAGAVLTAITLPRVVFLLAGGALADRIGAWRVMITSDFTMVAATLLLGGAVLVLGVQPYLLLTAALVIGVVDAFYLPSSGSMPRRLVPGAGLARAMSARQAIGQLATFAGASAGGLVVATAGLAAAAFMNAGTFVVMAAILIGLRPRSSAMPTPPPAGGTRCAAPPTVCGWHGPIRCCDTLGLIAMAAGFLLPVSGLLVPLLAQQRGWNAGTGGSPCRGGRAGNRRRGPHGHRHRNLLPAGTSGRCRACAPAAAIVALAFLPGAVPAVAAAAVIGLVRASSAHTSAR